MCAAVIELRVNDKICGANDSARQQLLRGDKEEAIFEGCFGTAQFILKVRNISGDNITYCSNRVRLCISEDDAEGESLRRMIEYVTSVQADIFDDGCKASVVTHRYDGKNHEKNRLLLASQILDLYKCQYLFFQMNGRPKIINQPQILPSNRLKRMKLETIRYIAAHLEQLRPQQDPTPIRYEDMYCIPAKVLVTRMNQSLDTYENQVVICFLHTVITELENICVRLGKHINAEPLFPEIPEGYYDPIQDINSKNHDQLKKNYEMAIRLVSDYKIIFNAYKRALNISLPKSPEPFKQTVVFQKISPYKQICDVICLWNAANPWDLNEEDLFSPLTDIPTIYEIYLFTRLTMFFVEEGWRVRSFKTTGLEYNSNHHMWSCSLSKLNSSLKIRIEYRPTIWGGNHDGEHTGLYRNNAWTFGKRSNDGEPYYSPDIIIRASNDERHRFLLIDAKFKETDKVKEYEGGELIFKYITSITPRRPIDVHAGLAILCGRGEPLISIYDLYTCVDSNNPPTPMAKAAYLTEMLNSRDQKKLLAEIMRPLLDF